MFDGPAAGEVFCCAGQEGMERGNHFPIPQRDSLPRAIQGADPMGSVNCCSQTPTGRTSDIAISRRTTSGWPFDIPEIVVWAHSLPDPMRASLAR